MIRFFLMIFIASAVLAGCSEQVLRPIVKAGGLELSVTCAEGGYNDKLLVKSASSLNTDEFTVVISKLVDEWGEESTWKEEWTLGEFPDYLELAPGRFRITVASPAKDRLQTDTPKFFVEKEFDIVENVVTPLDLVCAITDMKVSLAPTQNFFDELKNYTVTVSAEYEGLDTPVSVSWTEADFSVGSDGLQSTSKVAYFEPVPLKVMVTGNRRIDGSDAALKAPVEINDVNPRDHHILNINVQVTGELDTRGSYITIDGSLNDPTDVPIEVPGFEEIPLPDEPEQGEGDGEDEPQKPAKPYLQWDANPDFETVKVKVDGTLDKEVNLVIKCPGIIKEFVITPSENFHEAITLVTGGPVVLDLVNNEKLYEAFSKDSGMYLPTGDELRGHEEVYFNLESLASLIPIVAKEPGDMTTFSLYLEDQAGQTYTKDIVFMTVE